MLDQYAEFAQAYPGLLDGSGIPISWRHFVLGLSYLRRARARRIIEMNDASRMAHAEVDANDFRNWRRIQEESAGY